MQIKAASRGVPRLKAGLTTTTQEQSLWLHEVYHQNSLRKGCRNIAKLRVEFGKARCRLHGGLSTGPKTEVGRARIAEAQRRRWRAYREGRQGASPGTNSVGGT